MDSSDWHQERDELSKRFWSGEIVKATRKELERYLIVLANTNNPHSILVDRESYKEISDSYAIIVRHLLQIRLGEELHTRSHRIAIAALVVSVLAAGFAGFDTFLGNQKAYVTLPSPVAATNSLTLPLVKKPSLDMKSPPYNSSTNSKAVLKAKP
jgi:hypothetical protein